MQNTTKSTAVATINKQEIIIIETDGEKRVVIKPICDALGIDYSSQLQKLKADEILSSTMGLSPTVGADGKQREMQTIPFKFIFGWLFRIDSRNVKPEAKAAVIKYQLECYNALYDHFTGYEAFYHEKEKLMREQNSVAKIARTNFADAKNKLKAANEAIDTVLDYTFDDYKNNNMQLVLIFEEEAKGGQ